MFNPYTKAVLGAMLVFLSSMASAWDDSVLTTTEIITAVGAGLAALGVVWAAHKTVKWLWGGALAGVSALAIALQDDKISAQEWVTIAVGVLGTLTLIYATPNTIASNMPEVDVPIK